MGNSAISEAAAGAVEIFFWSSSFCVEIWWDSSEFLDWGSMPRVIAEEEQRIVEISWQQSILVWCFSVAVWRKFFAERAVKHLELGAVTFDSRALFFLSLIFFFIFEFFSEAKGSCRHVLFVFRSLIYFGMSGWRWCKILDLSFRYHRKFFLFCFTSSKSQSRIAKKWDQSRIRLQQQKWSFWTDISSFNSG